MKQDIETKVTQYIRQLISHRIQSELKFELNLIAFYENVSQKYAKTFHMYSVAFTDQNFCENKILRNLFKATKQI